MSTTINQPQAGYFARAAAGLAKAWREGLPALGGWCLAFWPFPVAAFTLAVVAVSWALMPGEPSVTERFKTNLEATGNWSDVRCLQAAPAKGGGTYLALATYGQKYRCKVRAAGGTVTVQFYRPNGVRANGTEVSRPLASYEVGEDGVLRAAAGNTEPLGQAAQEVIDALRPAAK